MGSRDTGEPRFCGCDQANTRTCAALIAEHVPAGSTRLYVDEWPSYRRSYPTPATVRHGVHAWARDADGDGRREVRGNRCEGAGTALRTYLRLPGGHKPDLHLYVATYEAMVKTTRVTPQLIRRVCVRDRSAYTGYT